MERMELVLIELGKIIGEVGIRRKLGVEFEIFISYLNGNVE